MLIVLSGLPGAGKTTIARELARATRSVHVRVDSIEQTLRRAGVPVTSEGYDAAQAVAADNLQVGLTVIADCVNPWPLTRDAWRGVAERLGVGVLEVEIVCPDAVEHQRRVETRVADLAGHRLPDWSEVAAWDYRPWTRQRLVLDTSRLTVHESVNTIASNLPAS
jgi:predicted kinase